MSHQVVAGAMTMPDRQRKTACYRPPFAAGFTHGGYTTWFGKLFCCSVAAAMLLGAVVGAERQLRQRMAGLRTNALVASGASLFVLVASFTGDDLSSAGRISGQVVSGIGFLGAGVIMREGMNVRGLNTAATLWCSAAIGVLCGLGLLAEALVGTLVVLCANVLLREAAQRMNRLNFDTGEILQEYTIAIVCEGTDEVHVRTLLLHALEIGRAHV